LRRSLPRARTGRLGREANHEAGAAGRLGHTDGAAVFLDDAAGDGQPEAGAATPAVPGLVEPGAADLVWGLAVEPRHEAEPSPS
jgi:hypothetical protein